MVEMSAECVAHMTPEEFKQLAAEIEKWKAVNHVRSVRIVEKFLREMRSEERMEIFRLFCRSCGADDPGCQCWNDE